MSAVRQYFVSMPDLVAIPIVFDNVPLGLVTRIALMELLSHSEHQSEIVRQPVARIMEKDPLLVDVTAPAAYIAKKITDTASDALSSGLIATEDGRYAGYVSPPRLLKAVAQENAARALAMKASVQKLDKARQDSDNRRREQARFMAFLGHEIRTPLTGILGVADLLGDKKLEPEAREYARTISESGRHLNRLLGDFLDLSRLEVGKLDIVPTSFLLNDFANETRMLWSARPSRKGVSLRVTADNNAAERIEGDATRLRQVLFNLIGNAVKFTEKGTITAHLKTCVQAGGLFSLEMTVTDTGIGIADTDKARLFEAFEQAGPQTVHRYGGTGLGLSIAKGLVEQMKGVITLADNPDGGTVFKVSCPVRKAGPRLAVENNTRTRKANFKLGRILLVDDHDVSRMVIGQALKAVGWTVDAVETAGQGQRRAEQVEYQAILLDLHLGDVSGIDLARHIRKHKGVNQSAPLLAATADVSAQRMTQCEQAGFNGFIEKPIRPRQLVAKLADTIVAHKSPDEKIVRLKAV